MKNMPFKKDFHFFLSEVTSLDSKQWIQFACSFSLSHSLSLSERDWISDYCHTVGVNHIGEHFTVILVIYSLSLELFGGHGCHGGVVRSL